MQCFLGGVWGLSLGMKEEAFIRYRLLFSALKTLKQTGGYINALLN